jgi:hypothetical protein
MHSKRTPDDRNARQKKLALQRETLRRLDSLSEADLRQAVGGIRTRPLTVSPSIMPTGPDDGC